MDSINHCQTSRIMSFTISLDPIIGMIAPYALHTILKLQELIETHQDEQAFQALKKLVKQFAVGFTSIVQGFWQFSHAISELPYRQEYNDEIKNLFVLAKVYTKDRVFI